MNQYAESIHFAECNIGHHFSAFVPSSYSMHFTYEPGLAFIKICLCSNQLRMKFLLLINVKMPTIVGILTIMSWKNSNIDLLHLSR